MKLLLTGASGFIGTNLIETLQSNSSISLMNLDIASPLCSTHERYWMKCDIMDCAKLKSLFSTFQPTHVIHLAARTDCVEDTTVEEGYTANTTGTQNVLDAVRQTPSVQRLIVTSSQYVCGPEHYPKDMDDYGPHTVYGHSKVLTEKLTKQANLSCIWTIIRPVNIWGPWHMRYRREAWNVIRKGLYVHPGRQPVYRCYGYVGNVVDQIMTIFNAFEDDVNKQIFYVGDSAINIYEWVNTLSMEITGHEVRIVPRSFIRGLGIIGDLCKALKIPFPISSSRYRSMTQDYRTPIDESLKFLGPPKYSLNDGVKETVEWLNQLGEN